MKSSDLLTYDIKDFEDYNHGFRDIKLDFNFRIEGILKTAGLWCFSVAGMFDNYEAIKKY